MYTRSRATVNHSPCLSCALRFLVLGRFVFFALPAVRLNPGWEFRIYNDDENRKLLEDFYPWFLATYDSYPKIINKVDAIRIFYLAKYGGIYMDLDYTCLKPFKGTTSAPLVGPPPLPPPPSPGDSEREGGPGPRRDRRPNLCFNRGADTGYEEVNTCEDLLRVQVASQTRRSVRAKDPPPPPLHMGTPSPVAC